VLNPSVILVGWDTVTVEQTLDMATGLDSTEHEEEDARTNPARGCYKWAMRIGVLASVGGFDQSPVDVLRGPFQEDFFTVPGLANRYQWDVVTPDGDLFKAGGGRPGGSGYPLSRRRGRLLQYGRATRRKPGRVGWPQHYANVRRGPNTFSSNWEKHHE